MFTKIFTALLLISGIFVRIFQVFKSGQLFCINLQAKNVPRDLAIDIPNAQSKLGVCIQEVLQFESTYQIITNADITLEVSDLFEEIYILMDQIGVINNTPIIYHLVILINLDQRANY